MDHVKIYGISINNVSFDEAIETSKGYLKGNKLKTIFTPNTEIVMAAKKNEKLKAIINRADLIIPDGVGLIYASRIRKKPLKERVTGFDLSMKLLDIANDHEYSIYLLGGKEGISKKAGDKIKKKYPKIHIVGYHNGYFNDREEAKILETINESKPDIIFVGLGFPKQEMWIDENKNKIHGKLIIGNGGVMDIISGKAKRAPELFQKLGLEWLYRLVTNPSRIKRQIALPKFMLEVIFNKNIIE